MYENILFEKKDGVAYLTLNRPDRLNALNGAVLKELDDALAAIDGDAEIRVLVVRGAGEKALAAGADITEMQSMEAEAGMAFGAFGQKVFAKMKKAYRNGVFVFAQGTFDAQIDGMVDSTGQPIARVNYGIAEGETYRFGGKEVITTEEDVLESFAAASEGEVFGVFVNLNDYIINTNMQMRTDRWRDNDNNQEKVKVTLVCDGKLADPHGVLILKTQVTK